MAIEVSERFGSRESTELDNPSVDLLFIIKGSDDDIAVKSAVLSAAPLIYDFLVRQSAHVKQIGPELWEGSVRYGRRKQQEDTGESSYQFETGGGTQHITQSLETVGSYAPSGEPVPFTMGAIGATADSVEGVDVTTPIYNFSETHYIPAELVTGAYKSALFFMTGRVNAGAFRGFNPGEVLFLGASGSKRGEQDWEITYRFAASPNVTGHSVGSIDNITKGGWHYLWCIYEDAEDSTSKRLFKRPRAAYVERVYPDGDFAQLGIG
jgi:hypothetical protein